MTAEPVHAAASGAGTLLAAATRSVGAERQAPKPLHPRGSVSVARISRCDRARTGVTWLDEPDSDLVLVRRSRAAGLPTSWPDVHGLALRVPLPSGGVGDLLLASTGWDPRGRFVLQAGRDPERLFFGSLLPYRSRIGPVLLGALPRAADSWVLLWARARGPWQPFAQLHLGPALPDQKVSFDPVLNLPPGLEHYDVLARLRLPAYRTARRARSDRVGRAGR